MTDDRKRFNQLIGTVLQHEGGYVDDPADPGGETKYGISKRSYPGVDIKNLTLSQASDIYYQDWWLRLKCNVIKSDQVAQKLLDTAVNVGAGTGVNLLQQALCAVGGQVPKDGVMSQKIVDACNKVDETKLLAAMRNEQMSYYKRLIASNPKLEKYARGWERRAFA